MVYVNYEGFENKSPEDLAGSPAPKPGKCQLLITGATEEDDTVVVEFSITAHELKSELGKTIKDWLRPNHEKAGSRQRLPNLATACGAMSLEEYSAQQKAGGGNFDVQRLVGHVVSADLQENEYKGKKTTRVGFRFFSSTSPASDGYPKDPSMTPGADKAGGGDGKVDVPF